MNSLRYLKESITDSLKMKRYYGCFARGQEREEFNYVLPKDLSLILERIKDFHKIDKNMLSNPMGMPK